MNAKTIWYHGGTRITDWSCVKWDRDRGKSDLNAEGPGMYWTTDPEEASGYACGKSSTIYSARLGSGFRFLPKKKPTLSELRELYDLADPERQEIFRSNWPDESLRGALGHYARQESLFDAFVTLYHDLFQYDADEFVAAMRSLGFDGYVVRGTTGGSRRREHLILWNVRALEDRQEVYGEP